MSKFILCALVFVSSSAFAAKLSDYSPYKYEVLFTNPECKTYYYDSALQAQNGSDVKAKSKNAYCKSGDASRSQNRENSPHTRLIEWIKDPNTTEIFMAYLSFSKQSVAEELCNAIKYRNVKVTLVYDVNNDEDDSRTTSIDYLKRCRPTRIANGDRANYPTVVSTGSRGVGSNKTGYAHNKLLMVNPFDQKEVKLVFSSGNMSSGVATHHENWHFITTSGKSYFANAHRCLISGMLEHDQGIREYAKHIADCRSKIEAREEDDIKIFFIPGEGKAALQAITSELSRSESVDIAVHRFSYGALESLIAKHLTAKKKARLVGDDDLYWSGVYRRGMGRNMLGEYTRVRNLEKKGLQAKYIETWADDVMEPQSLQLHHNKFLIFNQRGGQGAVFAGAGNLTSAAFHSNFENFYMIKIPEIYQAFATQYEYLWEKLGKSYSELPEELVLP
jgi:hypothetical protein